MANKPVGGALSPSNPKQKMKQEINDIKTDTNNNLDRFNQIQNDLAVKSMEMQTQGLARAMVMQGFRDLVKDAKDVIKDQGEAGHKP